MKQIPEVELQPRDAVRKLQDDLLLTTLSYVSANSLFYKKLFQSNGIDAGSIRSLDDLLVIPPTTKDQLSGNNWDFLCVPRSQIVEYTSTSGTLGQPVTIALSANDLERLAYNELISFACADGTSNDLYQLMLTLDRQFMAGIAYYEGVRKLGAGLVRTGPGLPAMQWDTIHRLQATVLVGVPSFIVKLIEFAKANNINLNSSSVRKIICIGESIRSADFEFNALGRKIKEAWDVKLYSTYASTEMQTAFTECGYGRGGHHHPELLHVELLDDKNAPVKSGEIGEVTITTFGVEAMPLIRYKTGDLAIAYEGACGCGRTTLRMGPIIGRKQQMIKLKGTTIYPTGIFEILQQVNGIRDYVVEVFTSSLSVEELIVNLSASDNVDKVEAELRTVFKSRLRVVPEIKFLTMEEIEKKQSGGRKIRKFIDNRNKF